MRRARTPTAGGAPQPGLVEHAQARLAGLSERQVSLLLRAVLLAAGVTLGAVQLDAWLAGAPSAGSGDATFLGSSAGAAWRLRAEGAPGLRWPARRLSSAECAAVAAQYHRCPRHFASGVNESRRDVRCEFNVAMELAYLPEPALLDCVSRVPPAQWAQDAAWQQQLFDRLQAPASCARPQSSSLLKPDWTLGKDAKGEDSRVAGSGRAQEPERPKWHLVAWLNHGFAYNLYVMTWSLANHWDAGVPCLAGNRLYRFSADGACGRGWSCELSPLSNCSVETTPHESVLVFGADESPRTVLSLDQVCRHGAYDLRTGRCRCEDGFLPYTDPRYWGCKPYSSVDWSSPRQRAHRASYERHRHDAAALERQDEAWLSLNAPGEENPHSTLNPLHYRVGRLRERHGFLWAHMQATMWLLKNARTRSGHEEARARLGLDKGRNLAMHVRHGDSCHDKYQQHRVCLPLRHYIEAAKRLEQAYGKFDAVYLATDDPRVVREAQQLYSADFRFVWQDIRDRAFYEAGDAEGVDVRDAFNAPEKVTEIARDVFIMARCHALVASMASSVAWVSYEFMSAASGFYVPFISVDTPLAATTNVGRFMERAELARFLPPHALRPDDDLDVADAGDKAVVADAP